MADVEIVASDEWYAWLRGFEELAAGPTEQMMLAWQVESEMFFAASQAHTHVLSGDMKASATDPGGSGGLSIEQDGADVETVVDYPIEYALYEHERGDEHAFLTLAYEESDFEGAMRRGWEGTLRSWR